MSRTFDGYDFLDLGCSNGGSILFAQRTFGGRGLGLDIDPIKVEASRAAGYEAIVQDCSQLDPSTMGRVRFVIMSHFLEHLTSTVTARRCIHSACRIAREFVLIQQPWFDSDPYLFDLGLKLYWSSWKGHANHMTRLDMLNVLLDVSRKTKAKRFIIGGRRPITSSDCPEIHPIMAPPEQQSWSPEHGPKPSIKFTQPVYRELFAVILVGTDEPSPELARYMTQHGGTVYFDSSQRHGLPETRQDVG